MNRSNERHFTVLPGRELDSSRKRSRFDLGHTLFTSFNVGQLIPFDVKEVYPGDTWKVETKSIIRLETLLKPIFSDLYFDYYYFFTPTRLLWSNFEKFLGSVGEEPWEQQNEYSVPQTTAPAEIGWQCGSLADYLGIPINTPGISVSSLPFRAYCKNYNDWFRNQNLQYEIDYNIDDNDVEGSNGTVETTYLTTAIKGGQIPNINKFKDYFTSCLPDTQRGAEVEIPIGNSAPLNTSDTLNSFDNSVVLSTSSEVLSSADTYNFYVRGITNSTVSPIFRYGSVGSGADIAIRGSNIVADLSSATGASINDVRQAFAIQKILERSARSGSRYFEYLLSAFGVSNGDLRMNRSEYLGGKRVDINVNEVLQTSSSTEESALGNEAAHSVSANYNYDFTKAFGEHGFLMCMGAVRYIHSYDRGVDKFWTRRKKYDFYDPMLAFLGEQPVLNIEIFAQGNSEDQQAFGFNEAWADLRFSPNKITGMMRTNFSQSLDVWHLADKYSTRPSLSSTWIQEDESNVDRVIAVTSETSHQIIAAFKFEYDVYRELPSYSIPSLIA